LHSVAGSANRAPASSTSTSRPRAASSFATTGPPPPAPITITSRIRSGLSLALARPGRGTVPAVVAAQLGVALGRAAVVRDLPPDGAAAQLVPRLAHTGL